MTRTVNGNAGLLVDPGCTQLIQALSGKYRYKIDKKGDTADTPEKNHPYSDFADALTYACLHHDKGGVFGRTMANGAQEVQRVDIAAWT